MAAESNQTSVKPDADGGQGESCHTGHLLSGDARTEYGPEVMICPDCAIHPRPPGATLLAFDVPSPMIAISEATQSETWVDP